MAPRVDFSKLNPEQREAVQCLEGPLVIYAGAGSGKTRTIVHRIAHMIDQGIAPSSIMAVTFTNKAAKEMRERVEHLIGPVARSLVVSTFHSACARFLRVYAKEAGFTETFSIYDDDDQKSLLKDCFKDLNVPEKFLSVAQLKSKLDRIKNAGETPEEYKTRVAREGLSFEAAAAVRFRKFGEEEHAEIVAKVYELYQKRLRAQNAMDFNDLLVEMVRLLENNPKVREALQTRFRYFMVDEFQDTNPIQFRLIAALCSHTHNLCIVGDDDQSIYSWRGAEPAFILDFNKHYPKARIIKLEQNYRSTDTIVRAATGLITHNLKRAPKKLWTQEPHGEKILVRSAGDPYEEAQYIANQVLKGLESGAKHSEFALLYRTNAQSRALEDELRRRMLPYIIYGSVRFYERAEIKTLLAYLRLLVNPDDDAAFAKVINTPKRGFGDKALASLKRIAGENSLSLARAADRIANNELPHDISRGVTALKAISNTFVRSYTELQMTSKPSLVLATILSSTGYEDYVKSTYPEEAEERWLNVLELKNALADFEEKFARGEIEGLEERSNVLAAFLEQAQLTIEPTVHNVRSGETEAISLMTVHASKGLEFDRVFVSGLEEGTLPHQNSLESEAAVEEERRLLYVAITRARKNLTLSHIRRNRFRPDFPAEASRFLVELPEELVERVSSEGSRSGYSGRSSFASSRFESKRGFGHSDSAMSEAKANLTQFLKKSEPTTGRFAFGTVGEATNESKDPVGSPFAVGQKVQHRIFGEGTVLGFEKSLDGWRMEIRFPMVGIKKLMHTFLTGSGEPRVVQDDG
jgi:DNA helicase II / ATP-dependent DNA helicase PcrA